MAKQLSCADLGSSDCDYTAWAETEEELMELFRFSPVCDTVCRPVPVEKTIEMVKS